jgi:threonyl-tRNA synthetase
MIKVAILGFGGIAQAAHMPAYRQLEAEGIRVEVDDRNETIGKKIRNAQLDKLPYMLIVGTNEVEAKTVAVRSRKDGDTGAVPVADFAAAILAEIREKRR